MPLYWRTALLLTSAFATVGLLSLALLLPVPYVVLRPGPAINTLGSERGRQLIAVTGHPTYPTTGALDLTTVTLTGGPGTHLSLVTALQSWFDSSVEVVPEKAMFPPGQTQEISRRENEQEMATSQESATVAAMRALGITVPMKITVDSVTPGTPPTPLRPKDVLVAIAGHPLTDDATLRTRMSVIRPGSTVDVTVRRDGADQVVHAPTRRGSDGRALFGIRVNEDFAFPFTVKIQIDDVGGPSAGMMFALGIVDTLTPGQLTGGRAIAGTGTIDESGAVGPIGGIAQKMVGARRAGATWFLAPAGNCDDVRGSVPDGMRVVKVTTLQDAISAVRRIGTAQTPAALPTCS
jgi:PDZ domain-containing protein